MRIQSSCTDTSARVRETREILTHGSLEPLSRSVAAEDGSEVEHHDRYDSGERFGSSGKGSSQDEGKEEDGCTGKLGSEKGGDLSSHIADVGQSID